MVKVVMEKKEIWALCIRKNILELFPFIDIGILPTVITFTIKRGNLYYNALLFKFKKAKLQKDIQKKEY